MEGVGCGRRCACLSSTWPTLEPGGHSGNTLHDIYLGNTSELLLYSVLSKRCYCIDLPLWNRLTFLPHSFYGNGTTMLFLFRMSLATSDGFRNAVLMLWSKKFSIRCSFWINSNLTGESMIPYFPQFWDLEPKLPNSKGASHLTSLFLPLPSSSLDFPPG